jgi:hypothetical protein
VEAVEVYEGFAHAAGVRLYFGLAVGVAAFVAGSLAVGAFPVLQNVQPVKPGARCAEISDIGAMRLVDGRPQLCRP